MRGSLQAGSLIRNVTGIIPAHAGLTELVDKVM